MDAIHTEKSSHGCRGLKTALFIGLLLLVVPALGMLPDLAGNSGLSTALAADFVEPFEGEGTIDAIYDDKIVIGDSLYVLSGLVRYYEDHTMEKTAGRYHFKVGTAVGFLVNREGKVEVLFLSK